jgi:hypothetical protein
VVAVVELLAKQPVLVVSAVAAMVQIAVMAVPDKQTLVVVVAVVAAALTAERVAPVS